MCSVWQPLRIHDLGYRPGAGFGEILRAGFLDGLQQSVSPDPVSPFDLVQLGLEAGSFVQAVANDIVREKRAISPDTALRLAHYFGTTPEFWLNLQTAHDLRRARRESGAAIEREVSPRMVA